MQNVFTSDELKRLMENGAGPRISLYMPTHRSAAGLKENQTRLKNLIKEAEDALAEQGVENAEQLTARAKSLLANMHFWEGRDNGLAMFLSEDTFRYYCLPQTFDELVVVAGRFHIKPLVRFLADSGRFFILCLSQSEIKLYEAGRYFTREMDLGDIPVSLEEAAKFDEIESGLQFRTGGAGASGGRRRAMFHGQGADNEVIKDQIRNFFLQVARGLNKILPDQRSPLVLAGQDHLCAMYREVNSYPKLMGDWVSGNYKELAEEDLLERAWSVAEPHFAVGREAAARKYGNLVGTGLASSSVEDIVSAAFQGRVESLFVPVGRQVWGAFHQAAAEAEIHDERRPGDVDLLDFAAGQAMANGAMVFAVEPDMVPGGESVAAVYRY